MEKPMSKITPIEARSYYEEYLNCKSKFERGEFIRNLSVSLNVDKATIHRSFQRFKNGELTTKRSDKGKPRFNGVTQEHAKHYAQLVIAAKLQLATKDEKTGETGRIVKALYNAGQLPFVIPTSTMNRWLNQFGYSYKQIKSYQESTGVRLMTDAPNRWWFVDSSVSELYYLNRKGRIIRDASGIITDKNHREERLTKKGLKKLLIFAAVDLYSDAYWVNGYITPGESATSWLMFFMDAFAQKADPKNPFRGIPQNIYSDRGSGLKNQQMTDMFDSLGIKFWDHTAGNAKAKGRVEARIGAYKNTIERYLKFEQIDSLERYRELTQKMIVADNIKKGHYARWMEIHQIPEQLKEFDQSLRSKVGHKMIERKVGAYGTVSLEGTEYFVSRRLNGEWVSIYSLFNDKLKATDRFGNTYELTDTTHQQRLMGKYKAEKKTDYDRELEDISETGKILRQQLKSEHFLDETPENLVIFDRKGKDVEVTSPFDSEKLTTSESAWYQVYRSTGYSKASIPSHITDKIDTIFDFMLQTDGEINPEKFTEILEIITDTIREAQAL